MRYFNPGSFLVGLMIPFVVVIGEVASEGLVEDIRRLHFREADG